MKQVWKTEDGKTFDDLGSATRHEATLSTEKEKKIENVKKTSTFQDAFKEYALNHYGFWELRAEDENCDFGGSHYQKLIGYYEGTLQQMIEVAAESKNFIGWGAGGSIKFLDFTKL